MGGRENEKAYSRREEYHVLSMCIGTSHGNPLTYTSERGPPMYTTYFKITCARVIALLFLHMISTQKNTTFKK